MPQPRTRKPAAKTPTTTATDAAPAPSLRRQYADWPQKDDQRPQPWDLDTLGIPKADRDLEPGSPNTIAPIVIRHRCPTLGSGAAGPMVADLAVRLHALGYATSIARGENPYAVLDHSVLTAVETFRREYGVEEDPTPYGGRSNQAVAEAASYVGPYTWEALIRVSDRAALELDTAI